MRNLTVRLKDMFTNYKDEHCNEKGRIEKDNVFDFTEKSKDFYVDTPENYLQSMEKHIEKDKELNEKEQAKIERELNGHKVMWSRFLRVGEEWGHQSRVKSAVITKSGSIPKLKGLRKTHKPVAEGREQQGLMRLTKMSKLSAETQRKCLLDKKGSTLYKNVDKLVVWSMDVEKLYPSLKAEEVSNLVSKAFLESELKVNVNTEDLSLYLALTVDRKELVKRGLGRVTHTRKSQSNNSPPGISTAEVFAKQKHHREVEEEVDDEEEE